MKTTDKIKNLMLELLASVDKFGQVTTDKGVIRWEGEDDLKVGDAVTIVAEDGTTSIAKNGEYTTEDGRVIEIITGKVAKITTHKKRAHDETADTKTMPASSTRN